MTSTNRWKIVALTGAVVLAAVLIVANAHLVLVALWTQPGCAPIFEGQLPSKRSC